MTPQEQLEHEKVVREIKANQMVDGLDEVLSFGDFPEIKDEKFHELRKKTYAAMKEFENYVENM